MSEENQEFYIGADGSQPGFNLDRIMKYTTNKMFIELIKIHTDKSYEKLVCMGFSRRQQQEFMTMLMRFGFKGSSLFSLYKIIMTINEYKRNLSVTEQPIECFVNYGNRILEFIEFLSLFPDTKSCSHFILNGNSAEKVKYCINSIQKLERIFMLTYKTEDKCIFKGHPDYLRNLKMVSETKDWDHSDDYLLLC